MDDLKVYVLKKYTDGMDTISKIVDVSTQDGRFLSPGVIPEVHQVNGNWKRTLVRDIIQSTYPEAFKHGGSRTGTPLQMISNDFE
jgi:hypothetical protein